jgi:hypothetical protein
MQEEPKPEEEKSDPPRNESMIMDDDVDFTAPGATDDDNFFYLDNCDD